MSTTGQRRGLAAVIIPAALALLVLGALAVTGCGSDSSTGGGASPAASASASSGPITVTDGSGASVTLQQPAARIVSLAPANTEIAFAIGAGAKMVAGTSYDDYPRRGQEPAQDRRLRQPQRRE